MWTFCKLNFRLPWESVMLEAKKKYEKSKTAIEELVAAGIMSEAEAAKV